MNRFLFIASDWRGAMQWPGGIATYIDSLTRGLRSLGDTVKVVAVTRPYESEWTHLLERYEPWVIPLHQLEDVKPTNWLGRRFVSLLEILRCLSPQGRRLLEKTSIFQASTASIKELEQLLLAEMPTHIVFPFLDVKVYALALFLLEQRRRFGIIAHGFEVGQLPKSKWNDTVTRGVMLKGADWIAANSQHTKTLLEAWSIPAKRIRVLHPPFSGEVLRESAIPNSESIDENGLNLVTLCRIVKGKGIDIVISALKILAERRIPFRYVVGGEGPERPVVEALADKLGVRDKVQFKGFVDGPEKWRILRSSDVFVMPSRAESVIHQEGFGIAFVEAAAFGIPGIGSRTGGIPDAVIDGETGILVPDESPSGLADALTFLYRNPETRKRMGRSARERAIREFSPAAVAGRFKEEIARCSRP